jgi:hypothetical protein
MENEKPNKAEEPLIPYGKKRITFFNSFEEENEAQIAYWRILTPEQRLRQHYIISLEVFSGFEGYTGNRLTFD